ncbi:MAG: hypothetical protein K0S18_620 [Anaerocolumna sp.]|jgi:hypothetical protein|nr:hypothetical protein [Anaerocolumna sp.]
MILNVIDEELKDTLLSKSYKLINTIEDIHKKKIWLFEYNPSLFCLDINDEEIKQKCFFSDALKMTF